MACTKQDFLLKDGPSGFLGGGVGGVVLGNYPQVKTHEQKKLAKSQLQKKNNPPKKYLYNLKLEKKLLLRNIAKH